VVYTLAETDYVCNYILRGGNKAEFLETFKGACSAGFDPDIHLQAVGVANQTTMLRGETEEVQRRIKNAMIERFGADKLDRHFVSLTRSAARPRSAGRPGKAALRTDAPPSGHRRLQFFQHLAPRRNGRSQTPDFFLSRMRP